MLRETEIREDWAAITIAVKQAQEYLRHHDGGQFVMLAACAVTAGGIDGGAILQRMTIGKCATSLFSSFFSVSLSVLAFMNHYGLINKL